MEEQEPPHPAMVGMEMCGGEECAMSSRSKCTVISETAGGKATTEEADFGMGIETEMPLSGRGGEGVEGTADGHEESIDDDEDAAAAAAGARGGSEADEEGIATGGGGGGEAIEEAAAAGGS